MNLLKYSLKRLLMLIPVIIGVTFILYFVMSLSPGNPALQILGADASQEQLAAQEALMGLDKPIIVQYANYMLGVLHMDFGTSWVNGNDVLTEFGQKLPITLILAVLSTLWPIALGIPIGIYSAVKQYSIFDYGSMVVAMLLFSLPAFWLGLMCQILFCLTLKWLPSAGVGTWKHLILPSVILGASTLASMIRMSRTSMLDVLKQDYIRTARSKGASERIVILRHAVRNSLIPVITQIGICFAGCIGGAVVTETVFALPGVGALLINAVKSRDIPIVMGTVIFIAIIVGVINLIVDLICAKVDPRIDLAA
ncbi:ABC transporter permease [Ruminococcus sp. 5_1_39BFAA]|uniref:ABC transporter permease n=1 Tax=Ruminococcus sp. 5_1_39BFAA TaxID=457412 RepID=UPI0035621607